MSAPERGGNALMLRNALLLLLALVGGGLVGLGSEMRVHSEAPDQVAGAGLLVGVEGPMDVEVRGRPLRQVSREHRRAGGLPRSLGAGLLAFVLVALAVRSSRGASGPRWLRLVWAVPGVVGLSEIVARAGASAPTAAIAREHSVDGLLLYGLSVVLLVNWRG